MDEKTEELRDIFRSISDADTVTETQERGRGSLATADDVRAKLRSVVEDMREDVGFDTTLSIDHLVAIVEQYYEGASDAEIARELGGDTDPKTVARARLDLHIVREQDRDAPFSLDRLEDLLDQEMPIADVAAELDVSESTVRRYRRVIETQRERRRVADQYRGEFENILRDRDLAERLTSSLQETGLEDATEGQEVDVDM
jgi:DNA-directed RNA polymerase specialized sigma24 family protein